jgi:hypothetical protein
MDHDHNIEKLRAMGFTIGSCAEVRPDHGEMLYLVDDLYLYEIDLLRLAEGETTFAAIRAEYGNSVYPPNPYDQTRLQCTPSAT